MAARWRPRRPAELPAAPTPLAITAAAPEPRVVDLRAYWTDQAVEALRTTDVPTGTILEAFLARVAS
jgi:hypothetical protein